MDIKILGSGCPKCQRLEQLTREVAQQLGIEAQFDHVRDMEKIMAYPVVSTPALVIDGVVRSSGRMPSPDEIAGWLKPAPG
jgi:small redox-active disulfide protein 2